MRYLIKFTKESSIKFVGHLELMRTIHRIVRRSEVPVEYSYGFNPHIIMSLAQALSVGIYSKGEYLDLSLVETIPEEELIEQLNNSSTTGIKFLDALRIENVINEKKKPQAMAAVEMANYTIRIKCDDTSKIEEELAEVLKISEWNIIKKTKKGSKEVNIKPMLHKFQYKIIGDILEIKALLACGSVANLSPKALSDFILDNTNFCLNDSFVEIFRHDMLAAKKGKLVSLIEFMK